MNCDSWEDPKNSFTAAVTGLMLISDCGENSFLILCCHPLADYSLQSGKTDPVLVLKKFSHGTDTTVAQMVDIIIISHAVLKMHIVVDGSKDILFCNMFRNQVMDIAFDHPLHLIDIPCSFLDNACKDRIIYLFLHSDFLRIDVNHRLEIHHHIRKDLDVPGLVLTLYPEIRRSRILNRIRDLTGDLRSFLRNDLAGDRAYYILCQNTSGNTVF